MNRLLILLMPFVFLFSLGQLSIRELKTKDARILEQAHGFYSEKWQGEAYIIISKTDSKWRAYIDDDGNFEYEGRFTARPAQLTYEYSLEYSDGLEFYYQPKLTDFEVKRGMKRPDNVIGSYAVYWKKKNNKYKTGKFCHIYAPYLIDAKGDSSKCDLEILGNIMRITFNARWINNAVYPVILDPTFGYTSIGASTGSSNGYPNASNETMGGTGGTVDSIYIYVSNNNNGNSTQLGIYDESGGQPDSRQNLDTLTVSSNNAGWYGIATNTSPTMTASAEYWLGENAYSSADLSIYYDAVTNNSSYQDGGSLGATWVHSGFWAARMSIYVIYTESGGSSSETTRRRMAE